MKKPFPKLSLRVEVEPIILSSNDNDNDDNDSRSFSMGDSTFRQEGLTIGKDYLRIEGTTISRGQLHPTLLSLEDTIGHGAFNKVQRAVWQKSPEECLHVAVKQYPLQVQMSMMRGGGSSSVSQQQQQHQQKREMLIQELRSLCSLSCCETLVKLHGAFLEQDTVTIVLDYMDLGSLEKVLTQRMRNNHHPFTMIMVAGVAFQLLHGLEHLHQNRILHRDIKTENCLLNSTGQVKLCDFGIASLLEDGHSLNKTVIGTTLFMAPERLQAKQYGKASDVWSLGLVLCHLVSGEKPWNDVTSQVDLLMTILEEEENDDPVWSMMTTQGQGEVVEDGLKEIIASCLKVSPEMRMPARILLHSPWFSMSHSIETIHDAATRVVQGGLHQEE
jgi:serine/threonine protein kinase